MKGDEYVILEKDSVKDLDEAINVYFFHGYLPDGNIVFGNKIAGIAVTKPIFIQRMKRKNQSGT